MAILNENEVNVDILADGDVSINLSKTNGLKKTRFTNKYSSNIKSPSYGVISQEGTLSIFDFDGNIEANL